jgi:hypothetical protein
VLGRWRHVREWRNASHRIPLDCHIERRLVVRHEICRRERDGGNSNAAIGQRIQREIQRRLTRVERQGVMRWRSNGTRRGGLSKSLKLQHTVQQRWAISDVAHVRCQSNAVLGDSKPAECVVRVLQVGRYIRCGFALEQWAQVTG